MSSDNFKHINLEAIQDIADGDEEFIREIIGNALTTVSESIRSLGRAIAESNTEQTIFYAHKLKGSFAFIGTEHLQQLAIEMEASPGDKQALEARLSEMSNVAAEAEAELRSIITTSAPQT